MSNKQKEKQHKDVFSSYTNVLGDDTVPQKWQGEQHNSHSGNLSLDLPKNSLNDASHCNSMPEFTQDEYEIHCNIVSAFCCMAWDIHQTLTGLCGC